MNVAIVTPRYGADIVGGSETWARETAHQLKRLGHNVEIITTTGVDMATWLGHYPPGASDDDGVAVMRFPISQDRWNRSLWPDMFAKYGIPPVDPILGRLKGTPQYAQMADALHEVPYECTRLFVEEQGPFSQMMFNYLLGNRGRWHRVVFTPYLCASTLVGARMIERSKVRLLLAAHDEAYIHFRCFQEYLSYEWGVWYDAEYELFAGGLRRDNGYNYSLLTPSVQSELEKLPMLPGYQGARYVAYAGRASAGKGTLDLIEAMKYTRSQPGFGDMELHLCGTCEVDISPYPWIKNLGRLSRDDMYKFINQAFALANPSYLDSLGYSNLEAMLVHTPVVANGQCPAFAGLAAKSGGLLLYNPRDYNSFYTSLHHLTHDDNRKKIGEHCANWVHTECNDAKSNASLEEFLK